MSRVFFADARCDVLSENLLLKTEMLFNASGIRKIIYKGDSVAVKIHPGESGTTAYLRPCFVGKVVDLVKGLGGAPFVIETTGLGGQRIIVESYLRAAARNGFTEETIGCKIVITDGQEEEGIKIQIEGAELREVEIPKAIADADALIVLSHGRGHASCGFGGAIKNLGMGCVSKRAKLAIHELTKPDYDQSLCSGCGWCERVCRWNAIAVRKGKAEFVGDRCVGCSACSQFVACKPGALRLPRERRERLQTRIADAAAAVIKSLAGEKVGFINFLLDITKRCDCSSITDTPIVQDIGVLASLDPVSIDRASIDLINGSVGLLQSAAEEFGVCNPNTDKFARIFDVDPAVQLRNLENLGFGTTKYELVKL